MKTAITVSAPGKLMLLGEHAVVYGRPCIVTAVNQRMKATVELTDQPVFRLNAPDVQVTDYKKPMDQLGVGDPSTPLGTSIPKGAKFVEMAVANFLRHPGGRRPIGSKIGKDSIASLQNDKTGIDITTTSEFSSLFGFGSSSAATVCTIYALSELTGQNLDQKTIFDLSYKTVLDVAGKGSGFDVAAAIYGGTLYFVRGGEMIKPLKINHLPLIVGYSGIKYDTVRLIDEVAKKEEKYPSVINNIYDQIAKLVDKAKQAILKADFVTLGELMNFNEGYLATLGVEGKKLANMIYAARNAGAYGSKLSGAGIGDCMIAIAPSSIRKAVEKAINKAGGQIIDIKTNTEGVRVDE